MKHTIVTLCQTRLKLAALFHSVALLFTERTGRDVDVERHRRALVVQEGGAFAQSLTELPEDVADVAIVLVAGVHQAGPSQYLIVIEANLQGSLGRRVRLQGTVQGVVVRIVASNFGREIVDNIKHFESNVDPVVDLSHSSLVVVLNAWEALQMLLELVNVVGGLVSISMREVIVYGKPKVSADRGRLARGRIGTVILVNVELFVIENVADVGDFLEGLIEQLLEVELNQLVRDLTGLRRRPRRILSTSDARGKGIRSIFGGDAVSRGAVLEGPLRRVMLFLVVH